MKGKDFLSVGDLSPDDLAHLLELARRLKRERRNELLHGRSLALLFQKPSLRTRGSFEIAMYELGGHVIYLSPTEVGLGERERISDVARVLSRYVDAIAARTFGHEVVEELARCATVPVLNALSNDEHPCQAVADMLTVLEHRGTLEGTVIAFVGDGNNCAASLALGAALCGAHFRIASPEDYSLRPQVVHRARILAEASGGSISLFVEPEEAVRDAGVIYTDVWTSMGQEAERLKRTALFRPYQLNERLVSLAGAGALIMHPLPAHHGEELAEGMIDCPQSVIFDQAENRLHAQKAILLELLAPGDTPR